MRHLKKYEYNTTTTIKNNEMHIHTFRPMKMIIIKCINILLIRNKMTIMALFHCMVRHGSLLESYPLGTVPGTFLSTTKRAIPLPKRDV